MTSEFENQLDAAIENAGWNLCEYDHDRDLKSFKAGANLIKPLISELIKQRNYIYAVTMDQKTASIRLNADNKELLQLLENV